MSFLMAHDQGGLRLTGKIARCSSFSPYYSIYFETSPTGNNLCAAQPASASVLHTANSPA